MNIEKGGLLGDYLKKKKFVLKKKKLSFLPFHHIDRQDRLPILCLCACTHADETNRYGLTTRQIDTQSICLDAHQKVTLPIYLHIYTYNSSSFSG